jgi:hypothetical protein
MLAILRTWRERLLNMELCGNKLCIRKKEKAIYDEPNAPLWAPNRKSLRAPSMNHTRIERKFTSVTAKSTIFAALLTFVLPALAVTGPSAEPGDLARHVVMVLKRTAHGGAFCSGVVIAQDIVLTAAHCVGKAVDVRVHYHDAANEPVLAMIAEVAIHPGFRPDAVKRRERSVDLALLRLAQALPASFAPADLAGNEIASLGDRFRLAGFGVAREGADKTGGVLRLAELAARAPLSSLLLWAEDPSGQGAGACTGDSGAPFFAPDTDKVVAITAWASGSGSQQCGALTQAVFVAPQSSWIAKTLQDWNGH